MIELKDVVFHYAQVKGENPVALDGINLSISEGEFIAIVGGNGSGKSTLAKQMNGLLIPNKGDVFVFGKNTKDENQNLFIKQSVGMVFQNPENQMVASIVAEDVAFALENLGVPYDEMHRRVDDALAQVGMLEYRACQVQALSGGQKQRVALAGVVAMRPRFIVLDEPTSMLDPQGRKDVLIIMKDLNRRLRIGIILITQLMEEASLAKRMVIMHSGKIVWDGEPKQAFADAKRLESVGLKPAKITQFCHELRSLGEPIEGGIIDPCECAQKLAALLKR